LKITNDKYIEVLIQTLKETLEIEFEKVLEGTSDLSLTYTVLLVIGTLILNSFLNTSELVSVPLSLSNFRSKLFLTYSPS
jgi:hypothetical protein